MESVSIGSGITLAAAIFGIVGIVCRLIPKKNGFSQAMCDRVHSEVDRRLDKQEKDREQERKEILEYLRRIEDKTDQHIACHGDG